MCIELIQWVMDQVQATVTLSQTIPQASGHEGIDVQIWIKTSKNVKIGMHLYQTQNVIKSRRMESPYDGAREIF